MTFNRGFMDNVLATSAISLWKSLLSLGYLSYIMLCVYGFFNWLSMTISISNAISTCHLVCQRWRIIWWIVRQSKWTICQIILFVVCKSRDPYRCRLQIFYRDVSHPKSLTWMDTTLALNDLKYVITANTGKVLLGLPNLEGYSPWSYQACITVVQSTQSSFILLVLSLQWWMSHLSNWMVTVALTLTRR